ncbi:MAG: PAS domain S-box protein [Chloroflexota bacterium]
MNNVINNKCILRNNLVGGDSLSLKSLFNFESQELSSAALEKIIESIPSGVIVVEKASERIVYINNRFIEITGFNPIGLSLREYTLNMTKLYKSDNAPFLYEQLPLTKALFCAKTTRNQEMMISKADKTKLVALVNAKPLIDNGEITGAIAIFEDITERKKAEEALRLSEEKFSKAFKNGPNAVTITRLSDGKIIDGNDSVIDVLGYNPKEAIGKTTLELGFWTNPDDRKEFAKTLITKGSIKNQEFALVRKDGAQIIVNLSASVIYIQNEPCFISSFIDITERKRVEETLKQFQIKIQEYANNLEQLVEERTKKIKESEKNYRELYESFDEAFIAIDWELNIIHWNKAAERITTVLAKDALGKKIYEIMPEMTSVDITSYLDALQQKKPARFMMNAKSRVTGKPSIFEISTYPSTQGVTIIVEDKTQEEETKRLSTIGQVAGMVGHDIRNPLQAILSDVYLLKKDLTSMPDISMKSDISESLIGIEENVEYISKIVNDLQDYVKPLVPDLKETNIELVLDAVLAKRAIPKNIEISRVIQAEARNLISDLDLLKRIFANLINNAIQAMPNGGKLSIQAISEGTDVILTVEDTGMGIPEEVKSKLFQPLFTTKAKGQGFGLAAVKRMTEALGGTITFESQEGKGTKFIIRLPRQ